ncbi:MAG TPA: enoyl-CoA hydratase-related protein [Candidatus Sulfotelmatobacter sp.]|jgi:enoyl-CoA hydratase/carnithine racemase|nr:enoyl-CoA hydratase-related protein [Candidatus Sulfotelmatobacter sp.]
MVSPVVTPVVTYDSRDRVAVITIDNPAKRNALTRAVVDQLNTAWKRFEASDDRVAVLTASGDKAFTVGADLDDIPHDLYRAIPSVGVDVTKPIIGAVAGWVVGGGVVLAQFTDLLVAADNANFLYPEAKVGFAGGLVSSLAARIPHKIAAELILLGEAVTAQRAYEVGFVNKVVPVGQQLDAALDYAAKLAGHAPLVLSMLKRFVGEVVPKGPSELAGITRAQVDAVTFSQDIEEGLKAFKEKRSPVFSGR